MSNHTKKIVCCGALMLFALSTTQVHALSLADEIQKQINDLSKNGESAEVIETENADTHTPAVTNEVPIEVEEKEVINEEDLKAIEEYTDEEGNVLENDSLLESPEEEVPVGSVQSQEKGESPFPDVAANHPNVKAIAYLKNQGIVKGNADGTFRPEGVLNRAESLAIILRGMNIAIQKGLSGNATDVNSGDWFYDVVNTAYAEGIANGNPDGTFNPAGTVNQAAFLKIVLKSAGVDTAKYAGDVWYDEFLNYAEDKKIITNKTPGQNITRAQAAEIIYRVLTQ